MRETGETLKEEWRRKRRGGSSKRTRDDRKVGRREEVEG
jgi:hypothetical protein